MIKLRRYARDRRGFTLAELMVACIAVGALAAAALPVWATMTSTYNLRGEARRFFSELQKARMKSAMENRRYVVESKTDTFVVCQDVNRNGACGTDESPTTFNMTPNGVSFSSTAAAVSFFPNGGASAATTFTLRNRKGSTSTVTVAPAGRVRIG